MPLTVKNITSSVIIGAISAAVWTYALKPRFDKIFDNQA